MNAFVDWVASDAEAFSNGNGYDPRPTSQGGQGDLRNSIAHTHVSAELAYNWGNAPAGDLGDFWELLDGEYGFDSAKDQYQNALGREIAQYMRDNNIPFSACWPDRSRQQFDLYIQ